MSETEAKTNPEVKAAEAGGGGGLFGLGKKSEANVKADAAAAKVEAKEAAVEAKAAAKVEAKDQAVAEKIADKVDDVKADAEADIKKAKSDIKKAEAKATVDEKVVEKAEANIEKIKEKAEAKIEKAEASDPVAKKAGSKKTLWIILGIILGVLILVIGFIIYLMLIYNPVLVNGIVNSRVPMDVTSKNLGETLSEFTFSFWYYIAGWNYRYNETKTLLNWDDGKLKVVFKPKDNTMVVSMTDLNNVERVCKVIDIKLQKWNFVALTLWNRSLDILLDDSYSHSCSQDNSPSYVGSTQVNLFGNDGFNGRLSNLYFYNYARTTTDTLSLYYKGPEYKSWIYGLANKLQGAVNLDIKFDVDVQFEGDLGGLKVKV